MRYMFINTYAELKHIEVEAGICVNNDTRQYILELRSENCEHILSDLIHPGINPGATLTPPDFHHAF